MQIAFKGKQLNYESSSIFFSQNLFFFFFFFFFFLLSGGEGQQFTFMSKKCTLTRTFVIYNHKAHTKRRSVHGGLIICRVQPVKILQEQLQPQSIQQPLVLLLQHQLCRAAQDCTRQKGLFCRVEVHQ
jgi:hypothetical protein